jgi:ADP-ribosylglycohydrolase
MNAAMLNRAQGCLLGQLVGDSLGSLVEFMSSDQIQRRYPSGVRDMAAGGPFNLLAGQPTDDSEMALALARSIVAEGGYNESAARTAYVRWKNSWPFDIGATVLRGLTGSPNSESQANGALMRAAPLGIWAAGKPRDAFAAAATDAKITHPHPVCVAANYMYVKAIALAVKSGISPEALCDEITCYEFDEEFPPLVTAALRKAETEPPADYCTHMGWVLVAFQNAFYQLMNAGSLEQGIVDTVMRGGDTDTNAAICGALLGAVYGLEAIPQRWVNAVLSCRPEAGRHGVHNPRPSEYWPIDALELAEALLSAGTRAI